MAQTYFSLHRAPLYMEQDAKYISGQLLRMIWLRMPKTIRYYEMMKISKRNDGTWWIHPPGAWMGGWSKIPTTVGERVEKIWKFAEDL